MATGGHTSFIWRRRVLTKKDKAQPIPPNCRSVRDGDEWYCPTQGCGIRWEVGGIRPDCPLKGKAR